MSTEIKHLTSDDLEQAMRGSYYTICGAGGSLDDWVVGMEGILTQNEVGKPTAWYSTTGEAVNAYAGGFNTNPFQPDLTILLFPLEGLDLGRLAILRLLQEDRWFDDMINNMRGV